MRHQDDHLLLPTAKDQNAQVCATDIQKSLWPGAQLNTGTILTALLVTLLYLSMVNCVLCEYNCKMCTCGEVGTPSMGIAGRSEHSGSDKCVRVLLQGACDIDAPCSEFSVWCICDLTYSAPYWMPPH